jgi:UDP-N-acetyl-D-galactosamine dehydrogenase
MILSGRKTNEEIPGFVAKRLVQHLIKSGKNPGDCKVLIKGITFKENVTDFRNTKVVDVMKELESYYIDLDVVDAFADPKHVANEYGVQLKEKEEAPYDAVIVAVAHEPYVAHTEDYFLQLMNDSPILFDLKSIYPFRESEKLKVWRL